MRKLLIFCCCLLLILTCLPAGMAATISGRGYEDFELCYADNLDFINQNTGRHLLPLVLAKGEANADGGHRMYELLGDVLIIVGGGIRSGRAAAELVAAGADLIVTGTAVEKSQDVASFISELTSSIRR